MPNAHTSGKSVKHPRFFFLLIPTIFFLCTPATQAADCYWNVASGDWSTAANWKTSVEPASSYNAYINNGGTATITQSGEVCKYLYLGYDSTDSGTVEISSGKLTVSGTGYIGYSGTGTFTQIGGSNSTSKLCLGYNSGGSGIYNLQSGYMAAIYVYMGLSGAGTFTQTGGTNYTYCLYLGKNSGGNGTYNLQSGYFDPDNVYVGYSGTGTFTQAGGTNSISKSLVLGYMSDSKGVYNLKGGILSVGQDEYIGYSGSGVFNHSDGTNSISKNLKIGCNSSASYILSGSGNLLITGTEIIGYSSTGTFTQSGGVSSISSDLYLGYNSGSSGSYILSGSGNLQVTGTEYIGNSGTGNFIQTNGTNATKSICITSESKYTLCGGTLSITNGSCDNKGVFDFGAGTGSLIISNSLVNLVSGTGTLLGTSGDTLSVDANSILIVPNGFDYTTFFSSYSISGLVHERGTTFTIESGRNISGALNIDDFVDCQGTLIATSGGAINLNNGVFVSGIGSSVNLRAGNLYVNDITSGISDGTLSSYKEYIGYSETGMFIQSGGTNIITGTLYIGYNYGSSGSYILTDGKITKNSAAILSEIYIGFSGVGTFTQNGGSNIQPYSLYLGYNSSGKGEYNLSGGRLDNIVQYIGYSGIGTFTHNGGGNVISTQYLGFNSGSSGSYYLGGSGNVSASSEIVGFYGTGTFIQTAGTNHTSFTYLGYKPGSTGSYFMGGTCKLSSTEEYIGKSGTGIFTQTSGTNTVPYFYIGYDSDSSGAYYLSNTGILSGVYEYIGNSGTGTFTQLGGTNIASMYLYLGYESNSSGSYIMSGSSVLSSSNEYIGYAGAGSFIQLSGTNTATYINIGLSGTYKFICGTLNVSGGLDDEGEFDLSNSVGVINASTEVVPII